MNTLKLQSLLGESTLSRLASTLGISILAIIGAADSRAEEVTFNVDFRNGTWNHSSVGGPASSTGWAVNSTTGRGYSKGTTFFSGPDITLTVESKFFGTAAPGADNFRLDPVNTPGFAFQNAGSGDKNGVNLVNYQRIDFSFTSSVTMEFLELRDIDTASSSGTQAWRDAAGIELWTGAPPTSPGTATEPTISLNSPTNLIVDSSSYALPFAYATTLGNTQSSDRSAAIFDSSSQTADGFSVYLWNKGAGTGGKHGIVLQAVGNSFTATVPEPGAEVLVILSAILVGIRRRR